MRKVNYTRINDFAVAVVDDTIDTVSSVGHENKTYNDLFLHLIAETIGAPSQHAKDHAWVRMRSDDERKFKRTYNGLLSRAKKRGMKLERRSRDGHTDLRLYWPKGRKGQPNG